MSGGHPGGWVQAHHPSAERRVVRGDGRAAIVGKFGRGVRKGSERLASLIFCKLNQKPKTCLIFCKLNQKPKTM